MADALLVTQEDREAAEAWMRKAINDGMIRKGHPLDRPTIEAFARHRIAQSKADAARIAELEEALRDARSEAFLDAAAIVERWNGETRDGNTFFIAEYLREQAAYIARTRAALETTP